MNGFRGIACLVVLAIFALFSYATSYSFLVGRVHLRDGCVTVWGPPCSAAQNFFFSPAHYIDKNWVRHAYWREGLEEHDEPLGLGLEVED